MANTNAAFGLRPYNLVGGATNSTGYTRYAIQTVAVQGTTSSLFTGQVVIPLSTGLIDKAGDAEGGTVALLGVFMGCEYIDLDGKPRFSQSYPGRASVLANSDSFAYVSDDPNQIYEINCDGAAAQTIVFNNAKLATGVTGTASTGLSLGVLDVSTAAATAAFNLRIIGFSDKPNGDDAAVAGRLALVRLNNHFNAPAGGDTDYIGSIGI